MKGENYVRVEVTYKTQTANAVLVEFANGENNEWIPRSLLSYSCDKRLDNMSRGEAFQLEVLEWKALQIGLTYN